MHTTDEAVGGPVDCPVGRLVDAAEKYAANYSFDRRKEIRCDVLNAFYAGSEFGAAAERARWEEAMRQAWQMVDPLRPDGQPGSYARGSYNGIVDAMTTLRANLKTPNARLSGPQQAEET